MKIIEQLSEMMDEEVNDAEKYIKCALQHKSDNKALADVFYTLSNEELNHMDMLHEQTEDIISAYRKQNGEPPADMMAVYNYIHKKHIDHVAEVKAMQAHYKS